MPKKGFTEKDLELMGLVLQKDGSYKKAPSAETIKSKLGLGRTFGLPIGKDIPEIALSVSTTLKPIEYSVLTIDGIVAGLNGSKGLMRGHWSAIKRQKELYQTIIAQHLRENKVREHSGAVTIQYIGYKSVLMDWDNFCASFKHIGDSLQKMKIITGDSPKIVRKFIPDQIKCKRVEQKVVVIIKDYK